MKRERLEICEEINGKVREEFLEERPEEEVQGLGERINRGEARRQKRARQTGAGPTFVVSHKGALASESPVTFWWLLCSLRKFQAQQWLLITLAWGPGAKCSRSSLEGPVDNHPQVSLLSLLSPLTTGNFPRWDDQDLQVSSAQYLQRNVMLQ